MLCKYYNPVWKVCCAIVSWMFNRISDTGVNRALHISLLLSCSYRNPERVSVQVCGRNHGNKPIVYSAGCSHVSGKWCRTVMRKEVAEM